MVMIAEGSRRASCAWCGLDADLLVGAEAAWSSYELFTTCRSLMPVKDSAKVIVPSHTMLASAKDDKVLKKPNTLCSSHNLPPAGCSHFGGAEGAAKQHIASGQAAERALDIRAAAAAFEQVCS